MNDKNSAPRGRCLAVAAAATAGLASLVTALRPELAAGREALLTGRLAATPFTDLLEWWCATCALAAGVWLWCGTVALVASLGRPGARRPGRALPVALPRVVRRAVLLACGAAACAGLAAPAQAATGHHTEPDAAATAPLLDGLPLPDRPTGRGPRHPSVAARPAPAALPAPAHRVASVVVRPGDTLWSVAQHALPGPSGDAAVAHRWQRVYALNRGVVGPDPDLIRPGQRLRLPPP